MDWNKVGAIGSVGSFAVALLLFFAQVWPYPQWKAEQSQQDVVATSQTQMQQVAPAPSRTPTSRGFPKSIVFFLIASLLLASLSIWGAWRRPKSKLVIHRAVYAAGLPTEELVTDKLQSIARDGIAITVDSTLGGLLPRDPAFGVCKRLDVTYSYGSDKTFDVSRYEAPPGQISRLLLPEDSEIQRLTNQTNQFRQKLGTANQHLPIEILAPLNYGEVGFRRVVSGSVRPALSRVQLWVFAGDNLWYRQGSVKVDGCAWSVECQFGNTPSMDKPSGDFQIIAIADANIRDERLSILPDVGIKSEIIKVRRTHN
jgi:hypothetical protein